MRNHHFEQFLSDSFRDGVAVRELRLSHEEVQYIKNSYPKAKINPCVQQDDAADRRWYEICLYERIPQKEQRIESMDDSELRAEKDRLLSELRKTKEELERVRQELAIVKSHTK